MGALIPRGYREKNTPLKKSDEKDHMYRMDSNTNIIKSELDLTPLNFETSTDPSLQKQQSVRKERPPEISISRFHLVDSSSEKSLSSIRSSDRTARPSSSATTDSKADDSASQTSTRAASNNYEAPTSQDQSPPHVNIDRPKLPPQYLNVAAASPKLPSLPRPPPSPPLEPSPSELVEPQLLKIASSGRTAGPCGMPEIAEMYEEATEEVSLGSLSSLEEGQADIRQIGRIARWQRGTLVGSGSYGKVYLGMNLDTAELFVVKQVAFVGREKAEEVIQLEQEIALLAHLEHVNIVKYLGTEGSFEAVRRQLNAMTNELSIFLEYMPGGSIADLVQKFGELDETVMRKYTREVLEGLDYLHRKGIIHRDIKGQNILVDNRGVCKLADFGASRYLQTADSEANFSFKGTPVFMSPEVIMEQRYSKKSDVWSVGCTVLQMATGNPPFSEFSNHIAALFHITSSQDPPPIPARLSAAGRDFVLQCCHRELARRPYVEELLRHDFVRRRSIEGVRAAVVLERPPSPVTPEALAGPAAFFAEDDEEHYRKLRVARLQRRVPVRLKRDLSRRSSGLLPSGSTLLRCTQAGGGAGPACDEEAAGRATFSGKRAPPCDDEPLTRAASLDGGPGPPRPREV